MSSRSFHARVRHHQQQTGQPYQLALQHVSMTKWFLDHYELPEVGTPYEDREGGFIYINGGPYTARDLLEDQFPDAKPAILQAVIAEIERRGYDWVPRFLLESDA